MFKAVSPVRAHCATVFQSNRNATAHRILGELEAEPGRIRGDAMIKAILLSVRDRPVGGGGEADLFHHWTARNRHRVTPEAMRALRAFEQIEATRPPGEKPYTSTEFAFLAMRLRDRDTFETGPSRERPATRAPR